MSSTPQRGSATPALRSAVAARAAKRGGPRPKEAKGGGTPPSRAKRDHEKSGRRAETLAALYLQLKGYRILARRFKTPVGEIDLIAKRGRTLVFIEVKGRRERRVAAESIHTKNQARVVRAAQWWLAKHGQYIEHQVRFDVCLIAWYRWPHHIAHAFDAHP